MRLLRTAANRWLTPLSIAALVALVIATTSTVVAGAYDSDELVSHDSAAWTHCTTGDNQNGDYTNNCFYTPQPTNYEYNSWWCAAPGYGNFCPNNVLCQWSMGPDYGGQAVESWYDANGVWLRNSTDCVSQNYGYPWYDVYGP